MKDTPTGSPVDRSPTSNKSWKSPLHSRGMSSGSSKTVVDRPAPQFHLPRFVVNSVPTIKRTLTGKSLKGGPANPQRVRVDSAPRITIPIESGLIESTSNPTATTVARGTTVEGHGALKGFQVPTPALTWTPSTSSKDGVTKQIAAPNGSVPPFPALPNPNSISHSPDTAEPKRASLDGIARASAALKPGLLDVTPRRALTAKSTPTARDSPKGKDTPASSPPLMPGLLEIIPDDIPTVKRAPRTKHTPATKRAQMLTQAETKIGETPSPAETPKSATTTTHTEMPKLAKSPKSVETPRHTSTTNRSEILKHSEEAERAPTPVPVSANIALKNAFDGQRAAPPSHHPKNSVPKISIPIESSRMYFGRGSNLEAAAEEGRRRASTESVLQVPVSKEQRRIVSAPVEPPTRTSSIHAPTGKSTKAAMKAAVNRQQHGRQDSVPKIAVLIDCVPIDFDMVNWAPKW